VTPATREILELLVSELVTNSVRHGGRLENSCVELRVTVADRCVRVEVCDHGPGFDGEPPRPPEPHQTSGWGLYLVDRLSRDWGIERNPTRVWFEMIDVASPALPR
jgi:anti-sigma regulatory factor (Ser/Thr protein kinase)